MEVVRESAEGIYHTLHFIHQQANEEMELVVTFRINWTLLKESNDIRDSMKFCKQGTEQEFPYDPKKDFKTIPLHIPHSYGRDIFKACLEYFAKFTSAPAHITTAYQPGYPITLISYNPIVIGKEDLSGIVSSILHGIQHAEINYKPIEPENEDSQEDDDVDDNVVIEYEEDPELKDLMKKPAKTEYLPMEGE